MSLFTTTECGNQDLKRLELKGWKDGDGNLSSGANKVLVEVEEIQICWSLGEKNKQTTRTNRQTIDYFRFGRRHSQVPVEKVGQLPLRKC